MYNDKSVICVTIYMHSALAQSRSVVLTRGPARLLSVFAMAGSSNQHVETDINKLEPLTESDSDEIEALINRKQKRLNELNLETAKVQRTLGRAQLRLNEKNRTKGKEPSAFRVNYAKAREPSPSTSPSPSVRNTKEEQEDEKEKEQERKDQEEEDNPWPKSLRAEGVTDRQREESQRLDDNRRAREERRHGRDAPGAAPKSNSRAAYSVQEEMNILTGFVTGLREINVRNEARMLDMYGLYQECHRNHEEVEDIVIYRHLINPARNNSRYAWQDHGRDIYFQAMRSRFNKVDDLREGLQFLNIIPSAPQKLSFTLNEYEPRDTGSTSNILIRNIGCPLYGTPNSNEMDWVPNLLTLKGWFPVANYGVVATKLTYVYPRPHISNEAVFSGEIYITLANRELAELFVEVINERTTYLNNSAVPATAQFAKSYLSMEQAGPRPDQVRVDHNAWVFFKQFDNHGDFLNNAPGTAALQKSPFLEVARER